MTTGEQSRSPSFTEVLKAISSKVSEGLLVARPGMVQTYNPATKTAYVKPLLKNPFINSDGSSGVDALPVLPEVPIIFPEAGDWYITFPIVPGDNVLLIFCDRSLDNYWTSSGTIDVDPVDLRSHDLSDAIALPGFGPLAKLVPANPTDFEIGNKKTQLKMKFKTEGKVEVSLAGVPTFSVELAGPAAKLVLGDGTMSVAVAEVLQGLWGSMKAALDPFGTGHTHAYTSPTGPAVTGPPAPTGVVPSWISTINSTKAKIPAG